MKASTIWNTRLFTWREYERWLQLYYNRARYYNSELGRFISRDPIDISDDVNLYSYVGNSPVSFVDLMGTEKKWIRENEGNAWYISTSEPIKGNSWHAMLYYIINWEAKIISYAPNWFDNWVSDYTKSYFDTSDLEIKRAKDFIDNKSEHTVFIDKDFIDIENVDLWFKEELKNTPKYHTFINNCSTEVEKALEKWWININTPIDTPWHLKFWLEQKLQQKKLIQYFKN